jgi:hypothetical protein
MFFCFLCGEFDRKQPVYWYKYEKQDKKIAKTFFEGPSPKKNSWQVVGGCDVWRGLCWWAGRQLSRKVFVKFVEGRYVRWARERRETKRIYGMGWSGQGVRRGS